MTDWRVPLSVLDYGVEEAEAAQRVIERRWLSMGPEVLAFEQEFAAMQSARHAYAVSSATAALHLAIHAIGLKPGDEVIQPAINFVASANMTLLVGATPVFADICSLAEPTIDPEQVERLITPRTKAVIPMHYGGNLARMSELQELCKRHNLLLIEDSCHAIGARFHDARGRAPHGMMAGSIGDIGTFSFYANKNLACGEGGMLVTNRDDLAERIQMLRSHGMTRSSWERHHGRVGSYDIALPGFNYRLDELHAAIGRAQLAKLLPGNQRRRELLARYRDGLRDAERWTVVFADQLEHSSGHLMVVVADSTETRTKATQALREASIQTSMHYPSILEFSGFREHFTDVLELTHQFASRAITLPLHPGLRPDYVDEIASILRAI
ncbi:DegT/DnrJ/EryC1/StrS family aminotransferase [Steroidobacter sp.]|uniref:DegT/DnrJ/EryC1/StrS family aminotransferase n=1 Tax=Steroidobacter sp. TaxID=1978227 RepID=UPI001A450FA9|nr:DegT/DnrJ/EryC1/StrS family aminotransferase [Steroidobacter sp.]MBL8264828.1 DegT/DnrJ/EryC1/StrS family aminotransferase [Steroidobacter sp.]